MFGNDTHDMDETQITHVNEKLFVKVKRQKKWELPSGS